MYTEAVQKYFIVNFDDGNGNTLNKGKSMFALIFSAHIYMYVISILKEKKRGVVALIPFTVSSFCISFLLSFVNDLSTIR